MGRSRISKKTKDLLLEIQEGKCRNCKKELGGIYDVDHIIPHTICNDDSDSNLQLLCPNCHAEKTRGGERKRINMFKVSLTQRQPHCWNCWRRVSPYFFTGVFCKDCEIKILEDNLAASLKNFHIGGTSEFA